MCKIYNYVRIVSFLIAVFTQLCWLEPLYQLPPILPGFEAKLGQFPYQVDLKAIFDEDMGHYYGKNYTTYCAGALIGANKVLTMSHCVTIGGMGCRVGHCNKTKTFIDISSTYVVAATLHNYEIFQQNKISQWRKIASVVVSKDQVLAIAYTDKPFSLNDNVATIPVISKFMHGPNEHCVLAGYLGNTRYEVIVLMYGNFTVLESNNDTKHIMEAKVTSGIPGYVTGPLVCRNTSDPNEGKSGVLAGICKSQEPSDSGDLSAYFRLDYYADFIKNTSADRYEVNHLNMLLLLAIGIVPKRYLYFSLC